jgi:hypothetical protein
MEDGAFGAALACARPIIDNAAHDPTSAAPARRTSRRVDWGENELTAMTVWGFASSYDSTRFAPARVDELFVNRPRRH